MMVQGHDLPCTFIIEDNNRSVDSTLEERLPYQFRFRLPGCVIRNNYDPTYPHAGNGTKKHIVFKDVKWTINHTAGLKMESMFYT